VGDPDARLSGQHVEIRDSGISKEMGGQEPTIGSVRHPRNLENGAGPGIVGGLACRWLTARELGRPCCGVGSGK